MADFYKTIQDISEGLYKEKMSKFISFAIPVSSAEEAKETEVIEVNNVEENNNEEHHEEN